jgi:tetratricopeptide (TPR) repeat protein
MTFARPATKASQVILELSRYLEDDVIPSEFALAKYKRDLQLSMQADASEAYAGLGMIAGIEWDEKTMRQCFQNAIRLDDEFTAHANYAVALNRLGFVVDAAEQYRIAYELAPTDIEAALNAVMATYMAGELDAAVTLGKRLQNLVPNKFDFELRTAAQILHLFTETGTDAGLIQRCNKVAFDVLREHQVRSKSIATEIDMEDQIVFSMIEVRASNAEVDHLDEVLAMKLYDTVSDYNPNRYWVGYSFRSEL